MRLKIDFETVRGNQTLEFELLDNPGVAAWAEHCKKISSDRLVKKQPVAPTPALIMGSHLWAQQQVVQQSLANTTLPIPMPVTAREEITQQHLNVWHRWFTHHTNIIGRQNTELATEYHWLHELNQIVHRLEISVREWPKQELGVCGYDLNLEPVLDEHGFGNGMVDLAPHRQYHSWEPADLILDQAVHGKTTMQSFIDNDDPKNWDTTGHHISWGGCKLVNSHYRQGIYQGDLFRQWCNRNGVTQQDLWGDYPLGNIINRNQSVLDRIFGNHPLQFTSYNLTL